MSNKVQKGVGKYVEEKQEQSTQRQASKSMKNRCKVEPRGGTVSRGGVGLRSKLASN